MNVTVPKKLKILSYYLPSLYIVGGYVRNFLLDLPVGDIDIAADYTVDEVMAAIENSEFSAVSINKKLGTIKIFSCEDKTFVAEYTTFRIDSYPIGSGVHTPSDVVFTKDMELDARRRDFTVNALYFSVDTAELYDYLGGIADLNARVLRTTVAPQKVFSEDGLRILRLVRLAAELNFTIEENTLAAAKQMVHLLKDISGERIRDEVLKILTADTKYPCPQTADAHLKGFRLLDEIGALQYIFPDLLLGKGVAQQPKYHVYDVFEHAVQTMYNCPPEIRLAGLLHDIGKPASIQKFGSMYYHGEMGGEIARKLLGANGFKMSNKGVKEVVKLIETHMYDIDGKTNEKKLRIFIADNRDYIKKIIAIKRADAIASSGKQVNSVSADKLERLYNEMMSDGTPLSYGDLKIDGNDLEIAEIPADKRTWALRKVYELAVSNKAFRTRETQLQYLRGLK